MTIKVNITDTVVDNWYLYPPPRLAAMDAGLTIVLIFVIPRYMGDGFGNFGICLTLILSSRESI